jgi:hypothetical protein
MGSAKAWMPNNMTLILCNTENDMEKDFRSFAGYGAPAVGRD